LRVAGTQAREDSRCARSFRRVLTHYFADKDELIGFAFRLVVDRAGARVRGALEHGDQLEQLRAALRETLPLDDERRAEARVWLAFVGRSLADPRLADDRLAFYRSWRATLAQLIEERQQEGTLRSDLAPEAEAAGLIALVDGLALQAVSDPSSLPPRRQAFVLDAALSRLKAG
jgi:AcrR family transcriptional regulator